MDYLAEALTPTQTERATPEQAENSAGGYVWEVDCWTRLRRFLILGSEGGTYYASQRKATQDNVACLAECIAEDAKRTVTEIVEISEAGRAPKNDPAIFALAYAASHGSLEALDALSKVCRTGTHLFTFCGYLDRMRGWGRAVRRAVGAWYTNRNPDSLAYQLVKYRQRNGWTHRDVLRLAHPKAENPQTNALLGWAVGKPPVTPMELPKVVRGYEAAQKDTSKPGLIFAIRDDNLPREALPTDALTRPDVWDALLDEMPMTAMIRNLGNMSKVGLLTPTSEATGKVLARLGDQERIRKARVHPIQVLAALTTYGQGHGARGKGEWIVVPQIVDALDGAFELAFGNVESTGKRIHLALDVSGSMGMGEIAGVPGLTPRVGSGAMALVAARTEPLYEMGVFTRTYQQVAITAGSHLRDVVRELATLPMGGTDCALPMIWAKENQREVDLFCVYTDSETWAGRVHPFQALRDYRRASGIDAKLVVIGMVSNGFTIADPNDPGMCDVVGFDTSTPQVIAEFAKGF